MDFKEIKRLISLVEEANITHFSIEEDGVKVKIAKEFPAAQTSVVMPAPQAVSAPSQSTTPSAPETPTANENPDAGLIPIKAEMVGTFYLSPSPDAAPFVSVGDRIEVGSVVCILEAMKLFNEIESEVTGTIQKICVENAQPVEYGQTLFLIRP